WRPRPRAEAHCGRRIWRIRSGRCRRWRCSAARWSLRGPHRTELVEEDTVDILEGDLDRHAEPDLIRFRVLEVGHQPFPTLQLDQDHNARAGVGAGRMLRDDPGADDAAP